MTINILIKFMKNTTLFIYSDIITIRFFIKTNSTLIYKLPCGCLGQLPPPPIIGYSDYSTKKNTKVFRFLV